MNKLAFVILALATGSAAGQNTTLTIQTDGPAGVLCTSGTQAAFDGVPTGTAVSGYPNTLNRRAQLQQGTYLSATVIAYPTQAYQGRAGVNFFERAYARGATTDVAGTSASPGANGAAHGPHALLLTFQNTPGTQGKMVFSFRASAPPTGVTGGTLDIDNDGTIEVSATQSVRQEIPFTFGASGSVDVRVTNSCRSAGTGDPADFVSTWTEIWVGFLPDQTSQCTFTNYGQACGGVGVTGSSVVLGNNRAVTFLLNGAFANDPVVAIVGGQRLNIGLPGGCWLLANAEEIRLLAADGQGSLVDSFVVPANMLGTSYHQYLPVSLIGGNLALRTSDGVRVDCVR